MFWAPVPKTSVHKYCESGRSEDEIGFAEQRLATSPARYAVLTQQARQSDFRLSVSTPTNAGHDFRALGAGKYISHLRVYELRDALLKLHHAARGVIQKNQPRCLQSDAPTGEVRHSQPDDTAACGAPQRSNCPGTSAGVLLRAP